MPLRASPFRGGIAEALWFSLVVREHCLGLRLFTAQEAGHAFLLVMSLEAVAEQLLFDFDSLLDGEADAVVDSLLAVAHGDGSILGDLVGQLQDCLLYTSDAADE